MRYRSLQDIPYWVTQEIQNDLKDRATYLRTQADGWKAWGFFSNEKYWREEARIAELDSYRIGVLYYNQQEDEALEREIAELRERGRICGLPESVVHE